MRQNNPGRNHILHDYTIFLFLTLVVCPIIFKYLTSYKLSPMRWTREAVVNGLTISKCCVQLPNPEFLAQGPGLLLLHYHSVLTSFLAGLQLRECFEFFSKTLSSLNPMGHPAYHFSFYLLNCFIHFYLLFVTFSCLLPIYNLSLLFLGLSS